MAWQERANALLELGSECLERKEMKEAEAHFYEALEEQLSHDPSRDSLSLMRQMASFHLGQFGENRELADQLTKGEKLMDAAEALGERLGEWQMLAEQQLLRGRQMQALQLDSAARPCFERAVAVAMAHPEVPTGVGVVARVFLAQYEEDDGKAVQLFETAVQIARKTVSFKNEESMELLGNACLMWAKHEAAKERFEKAAGLAKAASDLFAQDLESQLGAKSLLLHSLSMADKVAEARKLCDDLIGLQDCDSPQMPDILIMVSLALHAQGDEERAQQVLEMAKKLRGDEDPEGTLEHTQKVLNETSKKKNKD